MCVWDLGVKLGRIGGGATGGKDRGACWCEVRCGINLRVGEGSCFVRKIEQVGGGGVGVRGWPFVHSVTG